jgi:hypothetical protein
MANEITAPASSGLVLYAVVRDSSARPWHTGTNAFVSYQDAQWSSYAITLTEQGTCGLYVGSFPAALTAMGLYSVDVRQRAGASPATSDHNVGSGTIVWMGTREGFVYTDASGRVRLDTDQPIAPSNVAQTVGDALNAARAQGFGRWVQNGTTLTLYAADGSTVVRQFTLDNALAPTSRT